MKKLKLRIAKFDRLLVVEQLEIHGDWVASEHVSPNDEPEFYINEYEIYIGKTPNKAPNDILNFCNNQERDEYAANLVKWITEEQFGGVGKLEIGKPCLVRDEEDDCWAERIFAGKLSQNVRDRDALFLTEDVSCRACHVSWKYAKPLDSAQPQIDGEIYTWEADE